MNKTVLSVLVSLLASGSVYAHHYESFDGLDKEYMVDHQSRNLEKYKRDYQMRKESIDALMTQYRNIGGEKGLDRDVEKLERDIQMIMKTAEEEASLKHYTKARSIIDPAYRQIKQAIVTAQPGNVSSDHEGEKPLTETQGSNLEKYKRDYQSRKESIDALMTQYRNISREKGRVRDAENLERDILAISKLAEHEASLENFSKARSIIDPAYRQIKQAIIAARNGEELVMSLNFATPKDEYEYYRVKIDSQLKAIGLFINQIGSERKRNTITRILKQANKEYDSAKQLAGKGNYEPALPLMDRALNKLRSGLMMVVSQ